MAAENCLWGAPRIHGELLKLGITISERTVSRYLHGRPTTRSQTWRTFFANLLGGQKFISPVMFADAHADDIVVDASDVSFRPAPSIDSSSASIHRTSVDWGRSLRPPLGVHLGQHHFQDRTAEHTSSGRDPPRHLPLQPASRRSRRLAFVRADSAFATDGSGRASARACLAIVGSESQLSVQSTRQRRLRLTLHSSATCCGVVRTATGILANHRNRIARTVSADQGLTPWENARLFGLLNMALADGYVAMVDSKNHYNYWRPVIAIQTGDFDGNPDTVGDPAWTPFRPTPPNQDYASGHSIEGGAGAEVLKQVFGTDEISFRDCGATLPAGSTCSDATPVFRSFRSFSEAAVENAYSRILIGFHFRKSVEEGTEYGRKIGKRAANLYLRPVH